jgi:MoaA/NifB/PqqE/SkfB family radical SAM enzyme
MKKFMIHLICAFVPVRKWRRAIRKKFLKSNIPSPTASAMATDTDSPSASVIVADTDVGRFLHEKLYYGDVPDFTNVIIELTNRCGYKCFCCPRELLTRRIGAISLEDIRLIAFRLEKHLHKNIMVSVDHFGEPMLSPDFLEKLHEIRLYMPNFKLRVTTTLGYRKDDSFWSEYLDMGVEETIVSFYGYDRDTYYHIHGVDRYEIALKNLRTLFEGNDKLNGRGSIKIAANFFQEDAMRALCSGLDIEKFRAKRDEFLNEVLSHKNATFYKRDLHNRGDGRAYAVPSSFKRCYYGLTASRRRQLTIDCDMNVCACIMDYNSSVKFGNLREQSLEEIYAGQAYKDFVRSLYLQDFSKYPVCAGCSE